MLPLHSAEIIAYPVFQKESSWPVEGPATSMNCQNDSRVPASTEAPAVT